MQTIECSRKELKQYERAFFNGTRVEVGGLPHEVVAYGGPSILGRNDVCFAYVVPVPGLLG